MLRRRRLTVSVFFSAYLIYGPVSVPAGVVIVMVPLTLLELTWRFTGALQAYLVKVLASAVAISACSLNGSARGFAVLRVANIVLLVALEFFVLAA